MKLFHNFKQKSLLERFLFLLGLLFLLMYFVLAGIFFFWKEMPVTIPYSTRKLMGGILLVYAIIRFFRILQMGNSDGKDIR